MPDVRNPYGSSIQSGRQTVTTGGTAVALQSAVQIVHQVDITAETDNTGIIVVGSSGVVASLATRKGVPLNAGDTYTMFDVDLSQVYLDTTVNTDGVTWTAVV